MPGHPIPDETFPQINPSGAPQRDFETIDASPNAFGALTARATGEIGSGLEQVATTGLELETQQARMDAQTHAAELHSWQSKQVTDAQEQFLSLRGRAAREALPGFQKQIDDLRTDALSQAPNPFTRQLVDQEGRRLNDVAYSGAARHAASQTAVWQSQTAADAAQTYGNQAVLAATTSPAPNVNDDVTVQRYLFNSDQERRNHASAEGYEGPAIDQVVAKNRGANVKAIVEQIAGGQSPDALKKAFDFYKAQEGNIDAGSRLTIQNYLRGPLNQVAGQKIADEEMHRPPDRQPAETIADVPANFIGAIKAEEGYRSRAYWDVKQSTVGFGTKATSPNEVIDLAEANRRFNTEITKAAQFVDKINPNLDPGTRAAMTSLTFNAGTKWADSGLGNAIRRGDLAAAKDAFLQYNQAGGQVNPVLVGRRAREAAWFGQGDISPVQALAPRENKGDVMLRVMNDPDLMNRPQVQAAALSHINKVYQAYQTVETQQQVTFAQKLKDHEAELGATGSEKSPIGQEEFISALGFDQGSKVYAQYQEGQRFASALKATSNNSPAQNDALLEQYAPQPGSENYAQRIKEAGDLQRSIAQNDAAKRKDPAAYTLRTAPAAIAAQQVLFHALQDQKSPPELRQAAARTYADTVMAEQARLGIPPEQQKLLPQKAVDAMVARLQHPDTAGGGAAVGAQIEAEAKMWGDHWPDVYRQVAPKANAPFRVLGSGVMPAAAKDLVDNLNVKELDLLKNNVAPATKLNDITRAVFENIAPFGRTVMGADREQTLSDFRNAAVKLATIYVGHDNMDTTAAARQAVDRLVGFKYDFQGTYRVPKFDDADRPITAFTPAQISYGAASARAMLGQNGDASLAVAPPPDKGEGYTPEFRERSKLSALRRNGIWVNSPDEKGLMLVYNDQMVTRPDGQPLMLTWDQLVQQGVAGHAQTDAAVRESRQASGPLLP